jgi:hypothetical protein
VGIESIVEQEAASADAPLYGITRRSEANELAAVAAEQPAQKATGGGAVGLGHPGFDGLAIDDRARVRDEE